MNKELGGINVLNQLGTKNYVMGGGAAIHHKLYLTRLHLDFFILDI